MTAGLDDWNEYYEAAARKRQAAKGDPIERALRRQLRKEQLFLWGSSVVVLILFAVFCSVLSR
jgi:hypothetical protein